MWHYGPTTSTSIYMCNSFFFWGELFFDLDVLSQSQIWSLASGVILLLSAGFSGFVCCCHICYWFWRCCMRTCESVLCLNSFRICSYLASLILLICFCNQIECSFSFFVYFFFLPLFFSSWKFAPSSSSSSTSLTFVSV
jgi:hypothetical protein